MSALTAFAQSLAAGSIQVIDLTARLSSQTPIIQLPPEFGQTQRFEFEEISRYDDRGPAWYWNNFRTGEHTGTHMDAPNHWVTGRDNGDIASAPVQQLIAPAVVLDFSDRTSDNHDFLVEQSDVEAWEAEHGPIPPGAWVLIRTGWDARSDSQQDFINATETGPHTPGMSRDCIEWLAQRDIMGMGVETVGTDAGIAHSFDPMYPCHAFMAQHAKWGLTQLQNLAQLPPTGAVVVACPLPIVEGSGSPARVLALVER